MIEIIITNLYIIIFIVFKSKLYFELFIETLLEKKLYNNINHYFYIAYKYNKASLTQNK